MRIGPRHPRLGRAAFRLALPLLEGFCARRGIHRASSAFAAERIKALRAKLDRGETLYLGGICASGTHNSGVALIEVTRERGPKLICNNEEERFSGERHTTKFPDQSIDELIAMLRRSGLGPERIDAWFSAWDSAAFVAMIARTVVEEAPASFGLLRTTELPALSMRNIDGGMRMARRLGRRLGSAAPIIATAHHDNHAWFSFAVSPFAKSERPVMVAAIDGFGDRGAITLYVCEDGVMRRALLQRQHVQLARRLLCRHLVDPRRLDAALQRRPLHGRRGLGQLRPQDQSVLCAAARDPAAGARRPSFCQSRPGELAARLWQSLTPRI